MIYTVTFNPALDYVVHASSFVIGETNRADREELQMGGKGINVSLILRELDADSVALGFLAGRTGSLLREWVESAGVKCDFIELPEGMTRINVKLKGSTETELNGKGPAIPDSAVRDLFQNLDGLAAGDTLVVSGSIPSSLPDHIYEDILARLDGKDIRFVVDATGKLLENVLPYHPFLIKPNHQELGDICGVKLEASDTQAVVDCAKQLQAKGARNVLVSMAGAGALLLTEDGQVLRREAARGVLKNSVGAGDSMVAGFLAGYERGGYEEALRLGTAAGGATAFSDRLGTKAEIDNVYKSL